MIPHFVPWFRCSCWLAFILNLKRQCSLSKSNFTKSFYDQGPWSREVRSNHVLTLIYVTLFLTILTFPWTSGEEYFRKRERVKMPEMGVWWDPGQQITQQVWAQWRRQECGSSEDRSWTCRETTVRNGFFMKWENTAGFEQKSDMTISYFEGLNCFKTVSYFIFQSKGNYKQCFRWSEWLLEESYLKKQNNGSLKVRNKKGEEKTAY